MGNIFNGNGAKVKTKLCTISERYHELCNVETIIAEIISYVGRFLDFLHFRIPKETLVIEDYQSGCLPTEKMKTSTLWVIGSHLKSYFIYCLRREIAKEDPTIDTRLQQWEKTDTKTQSLDFEKGQLEDFLIHVPKDDENWWPLIASVIIGLYGLLRLSENLNFMFEYLTFMSDHIKCSRIGQGKQWGPKTNDDYFAIYSMESINFLKFYVELFHIETRTGRFI